MSMDEEEVREKVHKSLTEEGFEATETRVQPDPYSGWQIAVISEDFANVPVSVREDLVLKYVDRGQVEWVDALTPKEQKEWGGTLPRDTDVRNLPLWPETMARSLETKDDLTFLSDLEEDIARPITATFYSLRGGVGRSTALGYTARILGDRGYTVLCVDMDLEAPGLAALFGLEGEIQDRHGLVPLLFDTDQGERPDIMNHILRVSESDELYCLPAGRPSADYARMLRFIDPTAYYREERNPLVELIQRLKNDLTFEPDVLLFDARTGMNVLSGPLLFDLSDLSIVAFFPHPQAEKGTEALVRGLLASYTSRSNGHRLTPEPRFVVSPIPASNIAEVEKKYRRRAEEWITTWLSPIDERRQHGESFSENQPDLTHFVTYQEAIATSDTIRASRELWKSYEPIAEWIEGFLPSETEDRVKATKAELREKARREFTFPAGMAEAQDRSDLLETFVRTRAIDRALRLDIPLVRGRKGTGKTAIFRHLLEEGPHETVTVLAPSTISGSSVVKLPDWMLGEEGFRAVDAIDGLAWREFWAFYVALACYTQVPQFQAMQLPGPISRVLSNDAITSELEMVKAIQRLAGLQNSGLLANDWLQKLSRVAKTSRLLLFDGLDTGFGNQKEDRVRRRRAIEGLFSLFIEQAEKLRGFQFKIFLREDIWGELEFENKSHLYGRSVLLEWSSKADYLEVVIRHASRSEAFRELARETGAIAGTENHSLFGKNRDFSEEQIYALWYLLVSERMRGAKTAYTYNWVWSRLSDGTDDRSPRTLLQLFQTANGWEKEEASTYDKSIIRPRALIESLEEVSDRALSALVQEEFQELQPLIDELKEIGRTPVDADKLTEQDLEEEVSLAREVGLLEVYEGTEEDVQRFKVPDLYRLGIGMTRKGRA